MDACTNTKLAVQAHYVIGLTFGIQKVQDVVVGKKEIDFLDSRNYVHPEALQSVLQSLVVVGGRSMWSLLFPRIPSSVLGQCVQSDWITCVLSLCLQS